MFDLTNTFRRGAVGGISRVGKMFERECSRFPETIVVVVQDGELFEIQDDGLGPMVEVAPGDIYFIIDCFWDPLDEYLAFIRKGKTAGLIVATCFHDIMPAMYPFILPTSLSKIFVDAIPPMLAHTDICLSVSRTSLDDLTSYAPRVLKADQRMPHFGWFALGSDFSGGVPARDGTFTARYHERPLLLSVGTIEPKKGYVLSLDAVDALWNAGHDFNFLIIGRYGWHSSAVADRIKKHKRFGTHLFWQPQASDDFLDQAYRHCYFFMQASVAEGFGIPLLEAAGYGCPIICSDIDVFKEIGGDNFIYFESGNAKSLQAVMQQALTTRPPPAVVKATTWNEAFQSLCGQLRATAAGIREERT